MNPVLTWVRSRPRFQLLVERGHEHSWRFQEKGSGAVEMSIGLAQA